MRHGLTLALLIPALIALPACRSDETPAGYGGTERIWVLSELDGSPFEARVTMQFPEEGKIAGDAPCNRYFGEMSAPYPQFDGTKIASTRRACPEMAAEQRFLSALSTMTQSEILGDTLTLRNEAGNEMVFKVQ